PSNVTARQEEKCRAEKASPTPRVKKLNRGMSSSKPAAKSIQAVGHSSERAPPGRFDAMRIGHRFLRDGLGIYVRAKRPARLTRRRKGGSRWSKRWLPDPRLAVRAWNGRRSRGSCAFFASSAGSVTKLLRKPPCCGVSMG